MNASATPTSAFSPKDLRATLGLFATGVTIITTRAADGTPVGLTANSFNSVSMQPPLVLWSLGLSAGTWPVFQSCTHYAIHILRAEQQELALRFAARGVDRFADVPWREGIGGVPILDGAAALLECRHHNTHIEGDHAILIGEVLHCQHEANVQPLIFHGGRFFTELPL